MKKLFFILSAAAALVLAGCDRGGTSDAYNTSNGYVASSNSPPDSVNGASNSAVVP